MGSLARISIKAATMGDGPWPTHFMGGAGLKPSGNLVTSSNVALSRDTSFHWAVLKSAPHRSALSRMALLSLALFRTASFKMQPRILAAVRSALSRLQRERFAPDRFALDNLALVNFESCILELHKLAPLRSARVKSAS